MSFNALREEITLIRQVDAGLRESELFLVGPLIHFRTDIARFRTLIKPSFLFNYFTYNYLKTGITVELH